MNQMARYDIWVSTQVLQAGSRWSFVPMSVRFEVTGVDAAEALMLNISQRGQELRPAFDDIHRRFLAAERELFYTEGASGSGEPWPQVSPETFQRKLVEGAGDQTLREWDALFDSLTEEEGDSNSIYEATNSEAFYGTRVPYAIFHQAPRPGSRIPRRAPVDITDQQMRGWIRVLQAHLVPTDSALAGAAAEGL